MQEQAPTAPSWPDYIRDLRSRPNPVTRPTRPQPPPQRPTTPRNRFEAIRNTPLAIANRLWAQGKTILTYPEPLAPPLAPERPEVELANLIATQPNCDVDDDNTIVDTREATIAQEAARHGLRVTTYIPDYQPDATDNLDHIDTDPSLPDLENREPGWLDMTPYETIDRLTQYRIEWERRTKLSSPLGRIFPTRLPNGERDLVIWGYKKLTSQRRAEICRAYRTWHLTELGRYPDADAKRNFTELLDHTRAQYGQANLPNLTGELPPPSYFEEDEDPHRNELTATDPDLHDHHSYLFTVEDDPDVPPTRRYVFRGAQLPINRSYWTTLSTQERHDILDQMLEQLTRGMGDYLGSQISMSLDHELAATEWDLGEDQPDDPYEAIIRLAPGIQAALPKLDD